MAEFCSRGFEEYQRTLQVIYGRLEQYRRDTSGQLIEDIARLIDIIGRRSERLEALFNDKNVMESECSQQFNVLGEVLRMGNVGRPRV